MYDEIIEAIEQSGMLGALGDSKEFTNVPPAHQIPLLGLTPEVIAQLKGKRVLDFGCGIGSLVRKLRKEGVLAEGIDPRAPNREHFYRIHVEGVGRKRGIPVEDGRYNTIVSFQNPTLNIAFTGLRDTWLDGLSGVLLDAGKSELDKTLGDASYAVSEIGRTLARRGRAIIYPAARTIEQYAGHLLRLDGLEVEHEQITDLRAIERYGLWEGFSPKTRERHRSEGVFRTILRKK